MIMSENSHVPEIQIPAEITEAEDYKKLTKVLVGIVYNLTKEREKTNELLSELLERVKNLEPKRLEEKTLLSKVDEEIVEYVKKIGKVCAADVQNNFNYKGKNAASSRLNRMYVRGVLEKKQAGRTVYYMMRDSQQ